MGVVEAVEDQEEGEDPLSMNKNIFPGLIRPTYEGKGGVSGTPDRGPTDPKSLVWFQGSLAVIVIPSCLFQKLQSARPKAPKRVIRFARRPTTPSPARACLGSNFRAMGEVVCPKVRLQKRLSYRTD